MSEFIVENGYKEYKEGYLIQFGNLKWGYLIPVDKFNKYHWLHCIRISRYRNGDCFLFKNGKLIRSYLNGNIRILDKDRKYKLTVIKHK